MVRLRFSESAERDLIDIGNFIARDSPANAARFIAQLEAHCQLLAAHPLLGRARGDLAPEMRSLAYGRYVIFYRAMADGAEIVRVMHGRAISGARFGMNDLLAGLPRRPSLWDCRPAAVDKVDLPIQETVPTIPRTRRTRRRSTCWQRLFSASIFR
jgi:toxin ParE1/3/4